MRFTALLGLLVASVNLNAESWHGFCVVEQNHQRICSQHQPRIGDFSPICNEFARQEQARSWRAYFFTSLEQLRGSIPDYCDVVRDGDNGAMFACQLATICPGDAEQSIINLASRVYARDENQAQTACFDKEQSWYVRNFLAQSRNNCLARVAVELMPN